MEAISRTKRLLPQKRKNQKIREPLVLKGSLEIICDSSIKLRKNRYDPEGLKGVRKGISYNAEVENINFPKLMFPNWIIQAENMG